MRNEKGKLITVFAPGNHGAGGTTIATSLGIAIEHFTHKRTLMINKSGNRSYMERFLEKETEFNYTIDDLKVFNSSVSVEHILSFSTPINNNLYIVPGSDLSKELEIEDLEFEKAFLTNCLDIFDIVIADVSTGLRQDNMHYLENADLIIAVMTPNEVDIEDTFNKHSMSKLKEIISNPTKAITVFNTIWEHSNIEKELQSLNSKYGLTNSFGFYFDGSVREASCKNRALYTYLRKELDEENFYFPQQLKEFTSMVMQMLELGIDYQPPKKKGLLSFLKR